jgi:hypothetical protein
MTLAETHTLRKLDEVVLAGAAGRVETNYGEIIVHPTRFHGFVAEGFDLNNVKRIAFAQLPSIAFAKLAETLRVINN